MKKSRLLVGLVGLLVACSSGTRETPKGFKFTVIREGDGTLAKPGEFLALAMTYKDENDSVWMDTRDQDLPWIMSIQDSAAMEFEEGIDGIFRMLSIGDSIEFSITTKKFFEQTVRQPIPAEVDSTGLLTFNIGVLNIYDREQVNEIQRQLVEKQNSEFAAQQQQQLGKDTLAIDRYLDEQGIDATKTSSGLRYIMTKAGNGPTAKAGQTVSINYTGYLLDGTFFESSVASVAREKGTFQEGRPYEPYTLQAGAKSVIAGWEEAILLMNKGSKMTVYIPSTLAYGARRRSEVIVENSILVFELEMVDVK
jgi:FKBP-type peptidyl-prolyl cis-trans isomerase